MDIYPDPDDIVFTENIEEARVFSGGKWQKFWEDLDCVCKHSVRIRVGDIIEIHGRSRLQVIKIRRDYLVGLSLNVAYKAKYPMVIVDIGEEA
jgi:hypothetical protein